MKTLKSLFLVLIVSAVLMSCGKDDITNVINPPAENDSLIMQFDTLSGYYGLNSSADSSMNVNGFSYKNFRVSFTAVTNITSSLSDSMNYAYVDFYLANQLDTSARYSYLKKDAAINASVNTTFSFTTSVPYNLTTFMALGFGSGSSFDNKYIKISNFKLSIIK